jgi:hypothetical protein
VTTASDNPVAPTWSTGLGIETAATNGSMTNASGSPASGIAAAAEEAVTTVVSAAGGLSAALASVLVLALALVLVARVSLHSTRPLSPAYAPLTPPA